MRRQSQLLLSALIVFPLALYVACSSDEETVPQGGTSSGGVDAGTDRNVPTTDDDDSKGDDDDTKGDDDDDASTDAGSVERGPKSFDFDKAGTGDPSTLYWDETEKALYVADNNNNDIWKWTDASKTFTKSLTIPNSSDATDVGQLVRLNDGTFVVPHFGKPMGAGGSGIAFIKDDAHKGEVPNIDAGVNRVAMATDGDQIFGATFKSGVGTVTKVSLTDGETIYAAGFGKPVSIVLNTTTQQLFVVDQNQDRIYVLAADGGAPAAPPYDEVATVVKPDTTVIGPDGTLFTGQFKPQSDSTPPQIRKILPDGGVSSLDGPKTLALVKARGLAYDKKNKRLFIADSDGSTTRTIKIFPID